MAKRALFNVDAVISMLDDTMNDEELSNDEFGGYLSCEEMESCEDLVPCEEIPDQNFDGFTDNFICDEFSALQPTTTTQLRPPTITTQLHRPTSTTQLHPPTSTTQLHPPTSTTQLRPPITTTPTTTSHDTPQGPACTVDMAGKSVLDFFKLLISDEILSSIADQTNLYADQYICTAMGLMCKAAFFKATYLSI